MNAETTTLHASDSYRIIDFRCKATAGEDSGVEYQSDFTLSFVRKGTFVYNVYHDTLDACSGQILLNKPGFEHTVSHVHHRPDECTILAFGREFYDSIRQDYRNTAGGFFDDRDVHSTLVGSRPESAFLHHELLLSLRDKRSSSLPVDLLVHEILDLTFGNPTPLETANPIPSSLKKFHLETVETAKEYIDRNYDRSFALKELADNCCVSPFHFTRIFKAITSFSPHQYLIDTRLKNAQLLIENTDLPITEICFSSGFDSLEYFSTAFRKKFGLSPSKFRAAKSNPKRQDF